MNSTMHFLSKSSFASHFCILSFFINGLPISYSFFPFTCRYPNNKHENDFVNGQRVDFERVVYASEIGNEEYMENDDLPSDLLRLVEQDERQILPHLKIIEAVNLGIEEEKKEVKIGTALSLATRKELIDLLQDYSDVFAWSY